MSGDIYAMIMVGGSGTRLWPKSRVDSPKQLMTVGAEKSLLEQAGERAEQLAGPEHTVVITSKRYEQMCRGMLPNVPSENIIGEPFPRDTAAAIGLGAVVIRERDPDAVMAVLPADHLIKPVDRFVDVMWAAADVAKQMGCLVTTGIVPTGPNTAYGYIHRQEEIKRIGDIAAYRLGSFREKPDLDTARAYVESGAYYWNSGIFVWKAAVILEEMRKYMAEHHQAMEKIAAAVGKPDFADVLAAAFDPLTKVSVDYGIMEHCEHVAVMEAIFDWDDVGSWTAVGKHLPRDPDANAVEGDFVQFDSEDCVAMMPEGKLLAFLGLKDIIIVDTPDALFVAHKGHDQEVKRLISELKLRGREDLL